MADETITMTTLAAELCTSREAVHQTLRDITGDAGPLTAHEALERITVERRDALVGEQHVQVGQSMELYVRPRAADLVRLALCPCVDDRDAPGFDPYACQAEGCHSFNRLAGAYDPAPDRPHPTHVERTVVCPHRCGWSDHWWIDDGSAEAERHKHIKEAHGGDYGPKEGI